MKICIICRKERDSFNSEHVFPAAVGGACTITNVCVECNSHLGKFIDTPFCNNKQVLSIRHNHRLSRDYRVIKNPLSGKFKRTDNRDYIVRSGKNGMTAQVIPDVKIIKFQGFPVVQCTVPAFMIDQPEKLKKMAIDAYKKAGFEFTSNEIAIGEIATTEEFELTVELMDSNNPIIAEFIKIAYELGVNQIPDYFDSQHAKTISAILQLEKIDSSLEPVFGIPKEARDAVVSFINSQRTIVQHQCFAALFNWPSLGTIAFVRFYHAWYAVKLSEQPLLKDSRVILVSNDCKREKHFIQLLKSPRSYIVEPDWTTFSREHFSELSKKNGDFGELFVVNGKVSVYDKNGIINLTDLIDLLSTVDFKGQENFCAAITSRVQIRPPIDIYLKSPETGILFKIKSVVFEV